MISFRFLIVDDHLRALFDSVVKKENLPQRHKVHKDVFA